MKPGATARPGGIDDPARAAGVAADRGDAAIRDRDIARRAGSAGAVIHSAAADQDVMHGEVEGGGARRHPVGLTLAFAAGFGGLSWQCWSHYWPGGDPSRLFSS